jgi:hypothetical protein
VLKTCGKTPGDGINNMRTQGTKIPKSPNKKEREGGPGMLSNADLMKNRCNNLHKACRITETMTTWRRIVNIAELRKRK